MLRASIGSGELRPNDRLVEETLAHSLLTNRASVRSALAILEREQLVLREPNRGVRVRTISPAEAIQLLDVRAVLESFIARQAAVKIGADGIETLAALLERMESLESQEDLRGYLRCNADFHRVISDIAAHEVAANLLDTLQTKIARFQLSAVLYRDRITSSIAEHREIFHALRTGDADAAETATKAHVLNVSHTVTKISGFEFSPTAGPW